MQELEKLYNVLSREGLYTKTFEEFQVQYDDPSYRDRVFKTISDRGLFTKSREDFDLKYSLIPQKKKDESDFISEEEVTGLSTQEDRIAAGQSASSVLPTPEVEEVTALNVTENIIPLSDDEASKGVLSNQASNQNNILYQQGYYNLTPNQKNSFATAVLNGSVNPINDMTDVQFQGVDVSNTAVGKTAVELIEENFTEDGVTLNGVFHAPGTKIYQLAESLIEDKDISRGQQIDINSSTLNYLAPLGLDVSEENLNELITQYGADIDDNTLKRMGVDKKEYIDFVRKNYRKETAGYRFLRAIDNFGIGRFFGEENQIKANEVQRKAKREEEQYQRAMMFKKNKLESLLKDKSYLEAQLKRTEDPAEYKRLQAEIDKYDFIINTNLGQMMNLDQYFPNYKEHLASEGTAQILKKKRVYDAARGNLVDEFGSQTSEVLKEGLYGLGNLGNGIINYIPELADEFFSVLGGDNKGIWAGLSKNIRDNLEDYKMGEEGQVERKLVLQGKPVEYKGELYFVDEKSVVYDQKTGVEMTGIISPTDMDNIRRYAANIPDSDIETETVGRAAVPKVVGTIAYMYGLIRSGRVFSNKLQGLGMKGKKAGYVGMGLASYTASMTNNVQSIKDDLMKKGFTEEDALERAMVFGHTISTFDGLFAGLAGSNQKLLTGLGGVRKQLYNLIIKDPKKFNSAELKRKANDLLKENLREVFIEEIPVYLSEKGVNYLMNEYVGSEVRDAKVRRGEIEEVMLLTVGATTGLGGKQLLSRKDRAQTIDYISQNFTQEDIKKRLESLRKEGLLEENQAENVFNEIYNMNAANNQTQGTVQMAENKEPMADLLNRRRKLMEQRKGLEGPLKEDIDKKISAVDSQIELLAKKDKEEVEQEYKNQEDASKKQSTVAETSQDESTVTEEVAEGVSSDIQQPASETDTQTESETDQTTQAEVRTDFRINDVAGRPISISYKQGGKVVNEEVADKKAARKRINQLKFEDQGFTGVFQSSNPNVELELVEGEVIATNKKTGAKRKATQKFFNEYMDAIEFIGVDSNVETMINEGEIEGDQAVDFIIENSQNPVEIANQLQQTPKTKKGDTELEAPWEADFRLRTIKESDFDRFGDPNFKTPTMKRRWFKADAAGLDVIAQELSQDYNQEITEDMLIEFIKNNPSRKAPARTRTQTNEQRVALEQKFQELTGLKPTARNIRGVAGKDMITQPKSETERQAKEIEQMEAVERGEVDTKPKTQKEQVTEVLGDMQVASIKEITEATGLPAPTVRRILGQGAKNGELTRVSAGVYTLKTKGGKTVAIVQGADARTEIKRLVEEGAKFDMIFLDPPYKVPKGGKKGTKSYRNIARYEKISPEEFGGFVKDVVKLLKNENTPVLFMFSMGRSKPTKDKLKKYTKALTDAGLINTGVAATTGKLDSKGKEFKYGKNLMREMVYYYTLSGDTRQDLDVKFDKEYFFKKDTRFSSAKPVALLEAIIEASTKAGEIILDPFAGSGSTARAAVRKDRSVVTIEKDEQFAKDVKDKVKEEQQKKEGESTSLVILDATTDVGQNFLLNQDTEALGESGFGGVEVFAIGPDGKLNKVIENVAKGIADGKTYVLDTDTGKIIKAKDNSDAQSIIKKSAEQQLELDLETDTQSDSEASMAPSSSQTATNYSNNKSQALLNLFDKIKVAKDKLLTKFYDKYRPIRNLQKAIEKKLGRKMPVDKNFDIAEDLVYGKIRNKIDNFNTEMFNFFDKLSKKNIDRETLDEYLYAKHAVERNAHIREATDGENDAGSGITDAEAQQILDKFESEGLTQDLEQAADFIYAKTRETLDILKNEDLLSQTEYDNLLNNEYQNYVPLTGFDQLDVDRSKQTNMGEGGRTLPVRGKEIKTATGRKTKAASPLANVMKARERAIMRGGKNNVLVNLLDMLIENPDNDLYNVYTEDKPDTYKSINKDGKVVDRALSEKDMKNDLNYIRVVKGGKDYFIKFTNDSMQQAINVGMPNNIQQISTFAAVNRGIMNTMRKVYTTLSPAFIAVNYIRDFQTGLLNAMSELDAPLFSKDMGRAIGKIAKISLQMPKTIYAYNQGKMTDEKGNLLSDQQLKNKGYDPEYAKYYREFLDNGGQTGYGYSKSIDELKADIDAVSKPTTFKRFSRGLASIINAANIAAENSTRMAAFIEARQRGMSSAEAAQLAKNLTVNFNKSGSEAAPRALYLFFNASVGGTVRFAQAVTKLTKTQPGKGSKVLEWAGQKDRDFNPAQKLALILTNFSMMVAMLNGYNDEEDEDGVSYYEKIPDYVKTRNMIIMLPNQKGKYVKIPLPYGYNVFHNIGTAVGDGITGKRTVGEGASNVGVGMLEAFSPLSFNNSKDLKSFGINFVPSAVRPLAEVSVNENYFGSQIYQEAYPGQQISDAYLGKYKPGVANEISTFLAQAANEATGGSKRRPGAIDLNPDAIDYLMKQYLGVIYDMSTSTLDSGAQAYETFIEKKPKKEFDWKDIPIAGQLGKRFIGENSRYADISTYYERKEYLTSLNEEYKDILKGEGEFHFPKTVYGKAAALLNLSKDLDKELKKFRELKKVIREKVDKEGGTPADFQRIKTIEAAEDKVVDKFNLAFLKLFKRYSTKNKPVEVK
tara:strand:- start:10425 stop:18236 length:7812 start_codon:yes stop_codon:yes gene_type:complete